MKNWPLAYLLSATIEQGILTLREGDYSLSLAVYHGSVLRICYQPVQGKVVSTEIPAALSWLSEEADNTVQWQNISNGWALSFAKGQVEVTQAPLAIIVKDQAGRTLLEHRGLRYAEAGEALAVTWAWDASPVTGLGEKVGSLDKRGKNWVLWNTDVVPHDPGTDPLYESIPWIFNKRWGMFLNNSYRSEWNIGKTNPEEINIRVDGGVLDQWLILGDSPEQILGEWMAGAGKMEMPPLWALGHHQSRYSYHPQEQVLEIASTMRERHIPCDVIHLDIHYMDGYRDFTWDPQEFSSPERLLAELHEQNFNVVTIVDPGVKKDKGYEVYDEGLEEEVFCTRQNGDVFVGEVWPGPAVFPDFSQERVRAWWGRQQAKLLAAGVDGIWNDMNEPSVFNVPGKTFPLDVRHGQRGELSHAEVHNLYGSLMAQASSEGIVAFAPDKRPFVLTRAGFAGIQRYSAVWLGDNSSWWEHLGQAVSMCLNMGISGVAFVGTDIGGFVEDGNGELLARWAQLGAFTPFCRNHSNLDTVAQEPWAIGEEVEKVYREAMELRYQLLPTMYSLVEEASRTGMPIMRPLFLEFPDDDTAWRINDEFLFGSACLVAPVIQKGARERMVYLPEGSWQNRKTGEIYAGKQFILTEAALDEIPIFMSAGGIMAFGEGGEYTQADLLTVKTLEVFAHEAFATQTRFYADAGDGYSYTEGEYRRLIINAFFDGYTLNMDADHDGNLPKLESVLVKVHWGSGKITLAEWKLIGRFSCSLQ